MPQTRWAEADPSLHDLLVEVRRSGRRETLLVASTNIGSGWPLAHLAQADWTMRHPSLWMLAAVHAEELGGPGVLEVNTAGSRSADERRVFEQLGQDVGVRAPTLVAFPRAARKAEPWDVSRRFRYRELLLNGASPELVECLGREPRAVGAYLLWRCMPAHESPVVVEEP